MSIAKEKTKEKKRLTKLGMVSISIKGLPGKIAGTYH